MDSNRKPTGTTSQHWFQAGYQEALSDIQSQLDAGGVDAVRDWLRSNLAASNGQPSRSAGSS